MPKLNRDPETCGRQACDTSVTDPKLAIVRIWNMPSHVDGYRDYCVDCGHRIIRYNQDARDPIQLAWSQDRNQETEPGVQPMPSHISELKHHE